MDCRPDDIGQCLEFVGIAKNLAAQYATIDLTISAHGIRAEGAHNRIKRRCVLQVGAMAELIRVDDIGAPVSQGLCSC